MRVIIHSTFTNAGAEAKDLGEKLPSRRTPTLAQNAAASNLFAPILPSEVKRKKPTLQNEKLFHHNVYVILLNDAVAKHPSILRLNLKRDPLRPCVYVGMTGIPVDRRFENHKNGYKSAWVVRRYGVRLMPELYQHLNPMPFEAAVQMETDLAEDLRTAGYTVAGGH
jgi:predicted GIY-YIG superfamily endonuclease